MTSHRPAVVGTGTEIVKETVTGRETVILTVIKTETGIANGTATETERADGTATKIGTVKDEILVAPGEGAVTATTGSLRKGAMVIAASVRDLPLAPGAGRPLPGDVLAVPGQVHGLAAAPGVAHAVETAKLQNLLLVL
ncbi:uncharacterized protein BT62DRAFT_712166 [Guyanagaster necrorhizus]|uniref:Uncharacterized protein n=1 Tax=Guyanagaster necrorhizus TaxID=856835 RepID=A0A9P7VX55_9AGAR|nr:uncharacterized protein BT62DRAFT_712166 [Guyanagaster necrorhizus MCA 3950]KAG7448547.1 hypothetical protein BT62DRAFT_712166 [Guyanagaster necrorhizus MCA 3950]